MKLNKGSKVEVNLALATAKDRSLISVVLLELCLVELPKWGSRGSSHLAQNSYIVSTITSELQKILDFCFF